MKAKFLHLLALTLMLAGTGCGGSGLEQQSSNSSPSDAIQLMAINSRQGICRLIPVNPGCPAGSIFHPSATLYRTAAVVDPSGPLPEKQFLSNSCLSFSGVFRYESCYHNTIAFELVLDQMVDGIANVDLCVEQNVSNPRLSTPIFYDSPAPSGSDLELPAIALQGQDQVVSGVFSPVCPTGSSFDGRIGKCLVAYCGRPGIIEE